jgi:hypothetical protein
MRSKQGGHRPNDQRVERLTSWWERGGNARACGDSTHGAVVCMPTCESQGAPPFAVRTIPTVHLRCSTLVDTHVHRPASQPPSLLPPTMPPFSPPSTLLALTPPPPSPPLLSSCAGSSGRSSRTR